MGAIATTSTPVEIGAELKSLAELRDRPAGTVRITAVDYAADTYIWPRIRPVLHDNPEIRVELINDYGMTNIVEQRFDLGVRLGDQVQQDMIAMRIAPDLTMAVVGAPSYLDRRPAPKTPQELTAHNCINLHLSTRESLLPWELKRGRRELQARVSGQLVFNNVYQMLTGALDGFGLAYVPKELAEKHVQSGRLQWILEDWFPTFPGFHVYYPTRRKASKTVPLILDSLKFAG